MTEVLFYTERGEVTHLLGESVLVCSVCAQDAHAAGCVPSDDLTQAAREMLANPGIPPFSRSRQVGYQVALERLRAAVTPDERNEP